jgi:hypothetical protein
VLLNYLLEIHWKSTSSAMLTDSARLEASVTHANANSTQDQARVTIATIAKILSSNMSSCNLGKCREILTWEE